MTVFEADPSYEPPFPLKRHQSEVLPKMQNGCVLRGNPGSGKSYVGLVYYRRYESPRDIYIITTAKKRNDGDWQHDASRMDIGKDVTLCGKLVVDSWNNIARYTGVRDQFFIFDEQRAVGKGAWAKSMIKIAKQNRWIMLSGTPGDTWIEYAPLFIANGWYKNHSEFVERHVVYKPYARYPQIARYTGTATLERYRSQVLVEMPFEAHTTRHICPEWVDHDRDLYEKIWKRRWNPYKEKPVANASEAFMLVRRLVNTDLSRLRAVLKLVDKHPRLIIFYNFDYELELLRTLLDKADICYREWNGHKHQPVPKGDKWVYLVQYSAGAEAWNCVETNAICFYSLTYSYKLFEQSLGRIDRLNTPYSELYYYVLRSHSPIDAGVWKALQDKKNFNERGFINDHSRKGKGAS